MSIYLLKGYRAHDEEQLQGALPPPPVRRDGDAYLRKVRQGFSSFMGGGGYSEVSYSMF